MSEIKKAHKGSVIGRAVSAAAAGRWIESGFEFEHGGNRFRVVEPNHAGLRSYFSYQEVAETPPAPGARLIYAGPLADLLSGKVDILDLMRGSSTEPESCPCGDSPADETDITQKLEEQVSRLEERCAAYKGQVANGSDTITRLRTSNDHLAEKVSKLEAENKQAHKLQVEYREAAVASRARVVRLEGILSRIYSVALDGYREAEIIPF